MMDLFDDEFKQMKNDMKGVWKKLRSSSSSKNEEGEDNVAKMLNSLGDLPSSEATEVGLNSLSVSDFILKFRANSSECLGEIYEMEHTVSQARHSKKLSISLPQDVFHLVEQQLILLDEYLTESELNETETGDRLVIDCLVSILRNISSTHTRYKNNFVQDDFESCIAAANSFLWMVEKIELLMQDMKETYSHLDWISQDTLTGFACQEAEELEGLLGQDAVAAVSQDAVVFLMDEIREANIHAILLSQEWEDLSNNDVVISMTRILEHRIADASDWFDQDFLFRKLVVALARAVVCFYIECIVLKAGKLRRSRSTIGKNGKYNENFKGRGCCLHESK